MSTPALITVPFVSGNTGTIDVVEGVAFTLKADAPVTFTCTNPNAFNPAMAGVQSMSTNGTLSFTAVTAGANPVVTTVPGNPNQPSVARTIHILTHSPFPPPENH